LKSNKKKKAKSVETDIISFLDKRIKRIKNNLESKINKFKEAKNDLFSDKTFNKNISSLSNISMLIKK
jgi:hypothetical protein